jgi:hypothetical protein
MHVFFGRWIWEVIARCCKSLKLQCCASGRRY